MGVLRINSDSIMKYFGFFKHLDDQSKKKLILELTNSMKSTSPSNLEISKLYGAWDDDRSAEEIIVDIRNSRTKNKQIEGFE
jgi:hypothetical protein